jgi:virulence-associated protein VapD
MLDLLKKEQSEKEINVIYKDIRRTLPEHMFFKGEKSTG